jgi:hypothetical protein
MSGSRFVVSACMPEDDSLKRWIVGSSFFRANGQRFMVFQVASETLGKNN